MSQVDFGATALFGVDVVEGEEPVAVHGGRRDGNQPELVLGTVNSGTDVTFYPKVGQIGLKGDKFRLFQIRFHY